MAGSARRGDAASPLVPSDLLDPADEGPFSVRREILLKSRVEIEEPSMIGLV
jgi:hypothetical protein